MAAKPARPMRVTAASLPPVIITSASPYWMVRKALPMELAALAQAVTMHSLGPRRPHWIETCPLAELAISLGMVKAETLSGPLVSSRSCWVSISHRPPMPEPIITPQRNGSYLEKSMPESFTASIAATRANCVKRSSFFSSRGSM